MAELTFDGKTKIRSGYIHPRKNYAGRMRTNRFMLGVMGALVVIALIPLFWIIGYVVFRGSQYINLDFFINTPRPVGMPGGGVLHAIEGTILLTILAGLFSIPPGLFAAIYAAYHPNTPLGVAIRFGTDVLSGTPSIVVGIFAYTLIVEPQKHYSALSGGIALAILMLPIIIRTTEEMIKLVPHTLREGSLALGAQDWITTLKVTLPAAMNGIITGCLLGLARASGETAPLLFTALGNDRFEVGASVQNGIHAGQNIFTIIWNILNEPVDSLPLTLFKYTQQPSAERVNQSWAVALVLLLFVLVINIASRLWVHYRSSKLRG
jgi:phosphate transport system permease protein